MHGNKRSLFKKIAEVSIHKFIVYKSDKFTNGPTKSDKFTKTITGTRLKKPTVL